MVYIKLRLLVLFFLIFGFGLRAGERHDNTYKSIDQDGNSCTIEICSGYNIMITGTGKRITYATSPGYTSTFNYSSIVKAQETRESEQAVTEQEQKREQKLNNACPAVEPITGKGSSVSLSSSSSSHFFGFSLNAGEPAIEYPDVRVNSGCLYDDEESMGSEEDVKAERFHGQAILRFAALKEKKDKKLSLPISFLFSDKSRKRKALKDLMEKQQVALRGDRLAKENNIFELEKQLKYQEQDLASAELFLAKCKKRLAESEVALTKEENSAESEQEALRAQINYDLAAIKDRGPAIEKGKEEIQNLKEMLEPTVLEKERLRVLEQQEQSLEAVKQSIPFWWQTMSTPCLGFALLGGAVLVYTWMYRKTHA